MSLRATFPRHCEPQAKQALGFSVSASRFLSSLRAVGEAIFQLDCFGRDDFPTAWFGSLLPRNDGDVSQYSFTMTTIPQKLRSNFKIRVTITSSPLNSLRTPSQTNSHSALYAS